MHIINAGGIYMKAQIEMKTFQKRFSYDHMDVMTLVINYPFIVLDNLRYVETRINYQIMKDVKKFYQYVSKVLYRKAEKDYLYSINNNLPFHGYEAVMDFTITYNENCFLSYYYDQYEYTSGAHGNTTRNSKTFDLMKGRMIPLCSYFNKGTNYKRILINEIIDLANCRLQNTPGIYFDNYEDLLIENFNECNYFLSPKGLSIYYQQYEIAPYSTGIVVFTIPYQIIEWYPNE